MVVFLCPLFSHCPPSSPPPPRAQSSRGGLQQQLGRRAQAPALLSASPQLQAGYSDRRRGWQDQASECSQVCCGMHPPFFPPEMSSGVHLAASPHPQRNYRHPAPPGTVEELGLLRASQALFIVGTSQQVTFPARCPERAENWLCPGASWLAGCSAHSGVLRELERTGALRGLRT